MRDILLAVIVAGLLPAILYRPHLGAYAWAWVSLMNPQREAWGFATMLPFAQMVAIATIVGAVLSRKRHPFPLSPITSVYLAFLFWMSLTSLFALNTPAIVYARWLFVAKIHVMVFVTLMLLRGRKQIDTLIWVVTLSVGFFGIKGGVFTAVTGGHYRVWGPPSSMIEGNNELAVALVMLIPFMAYLYQTAGRCVVRWFMLFSIGTSSLAILGTQSRGALLSLTAMLFVLGLKSRRPVLTSVVLALLLTSAIAFMPDSWSSRMETIETYEQDTSAQARIYAWKTLWNLALDRPLTGAGFETGSEAVFSIYAPRGYGEFTNATPVAHSIYFQVLGEHGFPGLAIYLLLGFLTWRTAGHLARSTRNDAEFGSWVPLLMNASQISLIGFAVGGAFLALAHFDMSYYLVAYVVLVNATVRDKQRALAAVPKPPIHPSPKGAQ